MRKSGTTTPSKSNETTKVNGTSATQKPTVTKPAVKSTISNRPGSARRPASGVPSAKKPLASG